MNLENVNYLSEIVFPGLGFKNIDVTDALKAKMESGKENISLRLAETIDKNTHSYEFGLVKVADKYFVNTVKAQITNEEGLDLSQKFNLYAQKGFKREEMDNLLMGGSVYKSYVDNNSQRVGKWTFLDFNKKNESGNFMEHVRRDDSFDFRLSKEIGLLPLLKTTTQEQKEDLMIGMQKGNRVPVQLMINGVKEKMYIEASPLKEKIMVFNAEGKEVKMGHEKTNLSIVPDAEDKTKNLKDILNAGKEKEPKGKTMKVS